MFLKNLVLKCKIGIFIRITSLIKIKLFFAAFTKKLCTILLLYPIRNVRIPYYIIIFEVLEIMHFKNYLQQVNVKFSKIFITVVSTKVNSSKISIN